MNHCIINTVLITKPKHSPVPATKKNSSIPDETRIVAHKNGELDSHRQPFKVLSSAQAGPIHHLQNVLGC